LRGPARRKICRATLRFSSRTRAESSIRLRLKHRMLSPEPAISLRATSIARGLLRTERVVGIISLERGMLRLRCRGVAITGSRSMVAGYSAARRFSKPMSCGRNSPRRWSTRGVEIWIEGPEELRIEREAISRACSDRRSPGPSARAGMRH
jgi:hypothetical protein